MTMETPKCSQSNAANVAHVSHHGAKARGLVDLLAGGEILHGLLDVAEIPQPIEATDLSGEGYRYSV